MSSVDPRLLVVDLCRGLHLSGWAPGIGGGVSVRHDGSIYVAPAAVRAEQLTSEDLFMLDLDGNVVSTPSEPDYRVSESLPMFMNAYRLRSAAAVIHSQSLNAVLVTLAVKKEWQVTQLEVQKGLRGVGYHDVHTVPVIENTAKESDLADAMADAMLTHPGAHAVLVRRHGVFVWGRDWAEAKSHAECYDYLFEATLRMRQMGVDPALPPT
jgi:methylthioribulose-1-phosphate dehydratase